LSRFAFKNQTSAFTAVVPDGRYFVMGDNRRWSCDSRQYGAIPATAIVGKVVKIVRVPSG
jgi:signal peptidase I